ncbi:MAG: VCBS repeat-containing protein [Lewinella sp.]|nr:VCBS repeat-containing protein [Lewinella sp.]
MSPGSYPLTPPTYLLFNQGEGHFVEATAKFQGLGEIGMVTAAAAQDFNADGHPDLALATEFGPVQVWLSGPRGMLQPAPEPAAPSGWWQSLCATDWDGDGDLDLLAGNLGLNGPLRGTEAQAVCLYADDFDGNGSIDPLVTAYRGNTAYPIHPRNTLTRQIPSLKPQIPDFATYGKLTAAQLPAGTHQLTHRCATEWRSVYLENNGSGKFTLHPLPMLTQLAPIRAWAIPAPGQALALGNDYGWEVLGGRLRCWHGLLLER